MFSLYYAKNNQKHPEPSDKQIYHKQSQTPKVLAAMETPEKQKMWMFELQETFLRF